MRRPYGLKCKMEIPNTPEALAALQAAVAADQLVSGSEPVESESAPSFVGLPTLSKAPDASGRTVCMDPFPDAPERKAWEPKRLTPKHRQILSLYAQGMKREDIGALCKCTPQLVTMLATCEQGKQYLRNIEDAMDQELRGLYGSSINAIREQLESGSGENKLKAAKLQMQAIGKLGEKKEDRESAEDVIARIMNLQVNVQINNGS